VHLANRWSSVTIDLDSGTSGAWTQREHERRLAATLDRRTSDDVVLLHDRSVPGRKGNIDHIAVASTGVWVIDAKNYCGKIERWHLGPWRMIDDRLYVGGTDRTKLVAGMTWQADVVRSAIESIGIDADVHRVLCFTDADWGWLAKPFKIDGVIVTYPSGLASAVSAGGLLMTEHVRAIAAALNRRLPPA
jgi:hypothetical protein